MYPCNALFTGNNYNPGIMENPQNKELGQKLAIQATPTFLLYRDNQQVALLRGAKVRCFSCRVFLQMMRGSNMFSGKNVF